MGELIRGQRRAAASEAHTLRLPRHYEPEFEKAGRPEGFKVRRARVGYELGCRARRQPLRVPPGEPPTRTTSTQRRGDDRRGVGAPTTLRTPDGERALAEEAVRFPVGQEEPTSSSIAATPTWLPGGQQLGPRRRGGVSRQRQDRLRRTAPARGRAAGVLPQRRRRRLYAKRRRRTDPPILAQRLPAVVRLAWRSKSPPCECAADRRWTAPATRNSSTTIGGSRAERRRPARRQGRRCRAAGLDVGLVAGLAQGLGGDGADGDGPGKAGVGDRWLEEEPHCRRRRELT